MDFVRVCKAPACREVLNCRDVLSRKPFDVVLRAQVSERDDRLLTDQLLALEKANQEVAGDEDSEGEEPEGMCAPCQGFLSRLQPCPVVL